MLPDPFLTATEEDRNDPVRMDALRAQADREGRMLVYGPAPPSHQQMEVEANLARLRAGPTIARGNDRAFFKNLGKIAAGEVFVSDE